MIAAFLRFFGENGKHVDDGALKQSKQNKDSPPMYRPLS